MRTPRRAVATAPEYLRRAWPPKRRAFCAVLWLVLLGGCASPPHIGPIRSGEPVSIEVVMAAQPGRATSIRNQALANDTSVGAGSGVVVGGLWGLACGPLAVLCVPLGAGVGAMYGTVAGAAVGLTGALPAEKATQVRERLSQVQQSHDVLAELRSNVSERASKYWSLTSDQPKFAVTIALADMQLTSTRDERISLAVHVLVTVRPTDAQSQTAAQQKEYEYVGPFGSLTAWLDERSDFLETSLTGASQQIATQIVSELALN